MSFTEPEPLGSEPALPGSTGERQARRREHLRRRGLRRLDVAIGVLVAIIVLLIAPGVAVVAIVAVIVLLGCAFSLLYGRRRARRSRGGGSSRARSGRSRRGRP